MWLLQMGRRIMVIRASMLQIQLKLKCVKAGGMRGAAGGGAVVGHMSTRKEVAVKANDLTTWTRDAAKAAPALHFM